LCLSTVCAVGAWAESEADCDDAKAGVSSRLVVCLRRIGVLLLLKKKKKKK